MARYGYDLRRAGRKNLYTLRQILAKLFPFFRPEKRRFGFMILAVAAKSLSDVYLVLLSRAILNIVENSVKGLASGPATPILDLVSFTLFRNNQDLVVNDLPGILMLMGITLVVFFVSGYFRGFLPMVVISNLAFSIRKSLYGHLQRMDLYFFNKTRSGEITSRLTNDIMQGVRMFGHTVTVFTFQIFSFPFVFYFMVKINVPLTLVALGIGSFFLFNMKFLIPPLRNRSRAVQEKMGIISGEVNEKFGAVKITQSFTNEDRELDIFTERIDDHRSSAIHMGRLASFIGIVGQTIPLLGSSMILGIGAYIALTGKLSVADLMLFWMLRARLFQPFQMFANLAEQVSAGMGALDRIFEFFDLQPRVADRPNAIPLQHVRGEVEFRNLGFSYDRERGQRVLDDISFRVPAGKSVALVGHSGSGKTTAVDLISRFYDPENGSILVDGKDIRDYQLQSLRDHIGVVMQDAILFSGTIRENVLYGRPEASEKEVREALAMANAWEFVNEMREGFQTVIGERGISLSGGQRQRVAIARAFLKNPRILVLDEATSALDSVSEFLVQEALERLMHQRTTIVIAHRLSTIANVDSIIVLDKGRVVEEGTHPELMALDEHYAAYYRQQFDSFSRRYEDASYGEQ